MSIKIAGLTPLIQVFDIPRSLAFYRDLLGFEVVRDSGGGDLSSWVWLRKDGFDLMLNDQYEPGNMPAECPPERICWHRDTCLYFVCRDVDGVYDYLRSREADVCPPTVAPYGMKQLYLSDPDGYQICFQWSDGDE